MEFLGLAELINLPHESGMAAKGYDLGPFGGPVVFLGLATTPLPPKGTTVDRGVLRLDTGTGEVWALQTGDPPPAIGPTGKGGLAALLSWPFVLAIAAAAWSLFRPRR